MDDKTIFSINAFDDVEIANEIFNIKGIFWNIIIYKSIDSKYFILYKIYTYKYYYKSIKINNDNDFINQIKNSIMNKKVSINENALVFILDNENKSIKIKLNKINLNNEEELFILSQQFKLCQNHNINKINNLENKINELENNINNIKALIPKKIESIKNIADNNILNNNLSLELKSNEFKNIDKKNNNQNILNQNNYIEADYKIKDEYINKKIKVINSNFQDQNTNYESIKNCEIYINKTLKNFNYDFEFEKNNEKIIFNFKELLTNTSQLFYECNSLSNINLSKFISNEVTNTSQMFFLCDSITHLDLTNFKTNKVTDMNNMFSHCSSLQNLNISNFDTNNVKDMSNMFSECNSLIELDLSNFETPNVNDMFKMFFKCSNLIKLDIRNFSFDENTDTTEMFLYINTYCNIISNYIIEKN